MVFFLIMNILLSVRGGTNVVFVSECLTVTVSLMLRYLIVHVYSQVTLQIEKESGLPT